MKFNSELIINLSLLNRYLFVLCLFLFSTHIRLNCLFMKKFSENPDLFSKHCLSCMCFFIVFQVRFCSTIIGNSFIFKLEKIVSVFVLQVMMVSTLFFLLRYHYVLSMKYLNETVWVLCIFKEAIMTVIRTMLLLQFFFFCFG